MKEKELQREQLKKWVQFLVHQQWSTVSIEEISEINKGPKLFQLYIHRDRGLTDNLIERCKKGWF